MCVCVFGGRGRGADYDLAIRVMQKASIFLDEDLFATVPRQLGVHNVALTQTTRLCHGDVSGLEVWQ